MSECSYCGSDLSAYEPVYLEKTVDGKRVPAGRFCNYACLRAYIDAEGLTCGDTCEWSPEG